MQDLEPFDPDRLDLYLRRWGDGGGAIYGAILGLIVLVIAAIPLIEVPVSLRAAGILRSRAETQTLVAPVGGWIRWVRRAEDRKVGAGDTLLVLDRPELAQRAAVLAARREELHRELRDLEALVAGARGSTRTPALTSPRYAAERRHFDDESALLRGRLEAAIRERDRVEALASLGLAPAAEAEAVAARVRALRDESELLRSEALSRWQEALAAAREALRSLELEELELRQERRRLVIVAPSSGDLDTLHAFATGSYVAPGEPVARLTPVSALIAELYLDPGQLGSVRPGSPARLQVTSLASGRGGSLRGRVYDIAPQAVQIGGQVMGRLRVRPEAEAWEISDLLGPLRRGMLVTARLPVGRRSLWSLLRGRVEALPGVPTAASVPLRSAG